MILRSLCNSKMIKLGVPMSFIKMRQVMFSSHPPRLFLHTGIDLCCFICVQKKIGGNHAIICFLSDGNCNCRDFWFGAIVAIVPEMRWGLHPSVLPSCTTNSHHIHEGSKSMLCGGRLTSMLACVLFQCVRMRVQVCAFAFTTFHAYTPLYTNTNRFVNDTRL